MKGEGQYRPSLDMVERVQTEVIKAKQDAQAALHWSGYYYVRYQQQLHRLKAEVYLADQQSTVAEQQIILQNKDQIHLPSGQFKIQRAEIGLSPTLLGQPLYLRQRKGGEKFISMAGWGTGRSKAIQEAQIFPGLGILFKY